MSISYQFTIEREVEPGGKTVANSLAVPFRWVCRLVVEGAPATGILVGPRHVLTAAHVLDPQYQKGYALVDVEVLPAYDGGDSLGSYRSISALRVSSGWRAGKQEESSDRGAYDYGMVILSKDNITTEHHKRLGNKPLGYWGHPSRGHCTVFAPLGLEWLQPRLRRRFFSAGYHRGTKRRMEIRWGNISGLRTPDGKGGLRPGRGMVFDGLVPLRERAKGMSGGPVWHKVSSKRFATRFLVGVNTGVGWIPELDKAGHEKRKWQGYAARVTLELFDEVLGWMQAKP